MIAQNDVQQHPAVTAYNQLQQRYKALEAFVRWEDALFSNAHMSGNHKLEIRATRRAVERTQTRDDQGRARINLTTIAEQIGISPDTMSRGLKVLEQCGVIADKAIKLEAQENGERWTRYYVKLNEELLQQPKEIKPPEPRNHGGQRYICQKCGSDQVRIKKRITLLCRCCQHESLLEESEHDQEGASPEQGGKLRDILKPVSPPNVVDQGDPENEKQVAAQDDLDAAADLLLALAGQANDHIEMAKAGTKKYFTVDRPLTHADLLDHLRGGKARGASCGYRDGQTRGLCWDTDDQEGWQQMELVAEQLVEAGYFPLLEPSPAERGGHLWIVFDGLVDASAARHHIYSIALGLSKFAEYWPGPQDAARWNRVRLPGARYTRPGIAAWCKLISTADGEMSTDGQGAATLLLSHQTPVSLVPVVVDPIAPLAEALPNTVANAQDEVLGNDQGSKMRLGNVVDAQWDEHYNTEQGKRLWFRWSPHYLVAWWNERHDLDELLPSEHNGYGLASWRGERTASVAKRGERWADFGASARTADGNPDTGDALELQQRLTGAPKSEIMRQASRELLQEARQALESAAKNGQPLPAWLEDIIRDEGRQYYARLCQRYQAQNVTSGTSRFESELQNAETPVSANTSAIRNNNVLRIDDQVPASIADPAISSDQDTPRGANWFLFPSSSDQVSVQVSVQEGQGGLGSSAVAVPSSQSGSVCISEAKTEGLAHGEEWRQLEAIRDWGKAHEWPCLILADEEVIPAGKSAWLEFIWLSRKREQQRRVYEHITPFLSGYPRP